nr:retrotransposon protein, putative, Ty1-copia subclass [Tanacetum cinerariifolium]
AEYLAAFDASKEAVWVRKFIYGHGVVPTIEEPISMYCDNTASIAIANESGITQGARHFHAKVHYLREVMEYGDLGEPANYKETMLDPDKNLGKLHWVAVKHILKYLMNTRCMYLVYGGKPDTELGVTSFCDASWKCDKDDTKSQTGYVFVINGGAVDWKSKKKQTTNAMHSAQAEYVATSEALIE